MENIDSYLWFNFDKGQILKLGKTFFISYSERTLITISAMMYVLWLHISENNSYCPIYCNKWYCSQGQDSVPPPPKPELVQESIFCWRWDSVSPWLPLQVVLCAWSRCNESCHKSCFRHVMHDNFQNWDVSLISQKRAFTLSGTSCCLKLIFQTNKKCFRERIRHCEDHPDLDHLDVWSAWQGLADPKETEKITFSKKLRKLKFKKVQVQTYNVATTSMTVRFTWTTMSR